MNIEEVKAFAVRSITTKTFIGIAGEEVINTGCKMNPGLLFAVQIPDADFGGYQHVWKSRSMRPVSESWLVIAGFKMRSNGKIVDKVRFMVISMTDQGPTFCYMSLNPADYRVFSSVEVHEQDGDTRRVRTSSAITGIEIMPELVMGLCRECIAAFPETAGYLDQRSILFPGKEEVADMSDEGVDVLAYA